MKFGVREIVDVVFKATEDGQKVGTKTFNKYQPVFMIDTATTSSLEQATTTVYAQGGKGYARLIAWEGEKTMTFTVTDALMSPMGLAVLTGAGLISPEKNKPMHVHITINKSLNSEGKAEVTLADLQAETGLYKATSFSVCTLSDLKPYATKLDGSGAGIDWFNSVKILDVPTGAEFVEVNAGQTVTFQVEDENAKSSTVQLDFYLIMNNSNAIQEVDIEPGSFGGYFYVEAQTLFRREDSGQDMAAELIIPKAKIQSAFTFTMAASGDPSTFDFVMDAMPGYARFDTTKKIMCKIQILGTDDTAGEGSAHTHEATPDPKSPVMEGDYQASLAPSAASVNQDKVTVSGTENITIKVKDGQTLDVITVPNHADWGAGDWVAIDFDTGEDSIVGMKYTNRGRTDILTESDVADAEAIGLEPGHLAVWGKVSVAAETPATFTLESDKKSIDVTIVGVLSE